MDSCLDRAAHAIASATAGMTPEQLAWRPEGRPEAKWSAAEILEHLSLTFASTSKLLGRSLRAERLEVPPATRSQKLATLVVVGLGHMPKGRKAPEFTRPRGADPQTAPHDIQKNLHAMRGVIDECERRFGRRAKIALHAILGPLTAPQWRKFHWVHTRHHMRQIAALRGAWHGPRRDSDCLEQSPLAGCYSCWLGKQ